MSSQTGLIKPNKSIKVYYHDDFARITTGLKIATCMISESHNIGKCLQSFIVVNKSSTKQLLFLNNLQQVGISTYCILLSTNEKHFLSYHTNSAQKELLRRILHHWFLITSDTSSCIILHSALFLPMLPEVWSEIELRTTILKEINEFVGVCVFTY